MSQGNSGRKNRGLKAVLSSAPFLDLGAFVTHLTAVEGFVPHMYKDTRENVTLGIGLLLRDARAAKALPFHVRDTGKAAPPRHIELAFRQVRDSKISGRAGAAAFKTLTDIEISEAEARSRASMALDDFYRQLSRPAFFPKLAAYPANAQMALLDMAYTLGPTGTRDKFTIFTGAVRRQDWKRAGGESYRRDVGPGRNALIRQWLYEAAQA